MIENSLSPENRQKLLLDFPLLYRELRLNAFDCNDGWFDLVYQTSLKIEALAVSRQIPKTSKAWPSIVVVKEKFGNLRMQGLASDDPHFLSDARAIISQTTEASLKTCEDCSAPACSERQWTGGLILTLCQKCAEKKGAIPESEFLLRKSQKL